MINESLKMLCPGPGHDDFKKKLLLQLAPKLVHDDRSKDDNSSANKHNAFKRTPSEKLESVVSTLCSWSNSSRKRSIERRVIRAILGHSFLRHELTEMKDEYKLKFGYGQPLVQARSDAELLRKGFRINLKTITRQNKTDFTIQKCVDFILSDFNVSSVSWGSRTVLSQSKGEITLPKLTRKSEISQMYLRYKDYTTNDIDRLKSTSFYKICNVYLHQMTRPCCHLLITYPDCLQMKPVKLYRILWTS